MFHLLWPCTGRQVHSICYCSGIMGKCCTTECKINASNIIGPLKGTASVCVSADAATWGVSVQKAHPKSPSPTSQLASVPLHSTQQSSGTGSKQQFQSSEVKYPRSMWKYVCKLDNLCYEIWLIEIHRSSVEFTQSSPSMRLASSVCLHLVFRIYCTVHTRIQQYLSTFWVSLTFNSCFCHQLINLFNFTLLSMEEIWFRQASTYVVYKNKYRYSHIMSTMYNKAKSNKNQKHWTTVALSLHRNSI